MNIKDRITFIKAGYTKDEINEIIKEEMASSSEQPEQTAEAKPEEARAEDFMKVISALADEVKSLKKAVQVENIENTKMGNDAQSEVDRILQSVINPNITKEEN